MSVGAEEERSATLGKAGTGTGAAPAAGSFPNRPRNFLCCTRTAMRANIHVPGNTHTATADEKKDQAGKCK